MIEVATELLARARKLRREGALDEAEKLYREALAQQPTHFAALGELGTLCLMRGHPEEALSLLEGALQVRPNHFDMLFTKGNALFTMKRYPEAVMSFEEALRIRPDSAEAHNNCGGAHGALRQYSQALKNFDQAIKFKPGYADAHRNRGNALRALGRHEEAITCYDHALRIKPDDPEALRDRGHGLRALNRHEQAIASYDEALEIRPDDFEALENRGIALGALKRFEEAIASFDRALALRPESANVHFTRGNALRAVNRLDEAIASFDKAIEIRAGNFAAYSKRGIVLGRLGRFEEALVSFDSALELKADHVDSHILRAMTLQQLNRYREAVTAYQTAILLKPDHDVAHWNQSLALLLLGEFEEGWREYEWRWKGEWQKHFRTHARYFKKPKWLGQVSPAGTTILLWAEQGLGDTIQFVRYVPLLVQRGARVLLGVSPALAPLVQGIEGAASVIAGGPPRENFDLHCPVLSLPLAFGTTLDTIPGAVPYLKAPPERVSHWSDRLGARNNPRVGLTWSGRTDHKNDSNRSISLARLLPLTSLDLDFVSLQKEVRSEDQATLAQSGAIRHFGEELKDFADTAALVSLMDLVISVDTVTVHLAGALGKPVWVLLPFGPDWRWLLNREDSPWYPTARLFRQPAFGDWDSVVRRVVEELRKRFAAGDTRGKRIAGAEGGM